MSGSNRRDVTQNLPENPLPPSGDGEGEQPLPIGRYRVPKVLGNGDHERSNRRYLKGADFFRGPPQFYAFLVLLAVAMSVGTIQFLAEWGSEERLLMGVSFSKREISRFERLGLNGDGELGSVSEIPIEAVARVEEHSKDLDSFPKHGVHIFDGYTIIKWTDATTYKQHSRLNEVIDVALGTSPHPSVSIKQLYDLNDIKDFAFGVLSDPSSLVAAEYAEIGGHIVNYRLYILNLKLRLIVEIIRTT